MKKVLSGVRHLAGPWVSSFLFGYFPVIAKCGFHFSAYMGSSPRTVYHQGRNFVFFTAASPEPSSVSDTYNSSLLNNGIFVRHLHNIY